MELERIKINIVGHFFGTSGYCTHTRSLANELYEYADVRIETQFLENWQQLVNDKELEMLNKKFSHEMITIFIGHPQVLPLVWANNPKTVIPFVIWEGSSVPKYWICTSQWINPVPLQDGQVRQWGQFIGFIAPPSSPAGTPARSRA